MKPETNPPPTSGDSQAGQPPAFPLVAGWPGLFFVVGYIGFKCIGYACLILAGAVAGTHSSLCGALVLLALGHFAIYAAEVIDQMKREDSANAEITDGYLRPTAPNPPKSERW